MQQNIQGWQSWQSWQGWQDRQRRHSRHGLAGIFWVLFCGCGAEPGFGHDVKDRLPHIYARSTWELRIEVDYQLGAEPYTQTPEGTDAFELFEKNIYRLFNGHKELSVPKALHEMEAIPAALEPGITAAQIRDLAAAHRQSVDTADRATFYVLFPYLIS